MKKTETEQILEYLKHIYESINGPLPLPEARQSGKEPPLTKRVGTLEKKVDTLDKKVDGLSESVGKLDDRVSEVQLGLATLAAGTTAQFQKIDERFAKIDERFDSVDVQFSGVRGAIESTRVRLVDLVERVHGELTGRIIDAEVPGPGGRGGGGRGSGGVPLAS